MIIGAHTIIYSKKPETDRAFLRDVLKFPNVNVGEGWLILDCLHRRWLYILVRKTMFTSFT